MGSGAAVATPASGAGTLDGRHARRQRNRDAVVGALLALYRDGQLEPTAEQIAERSGVSARSLFRYFDDVDDLCRAAIERQLADIGQRAHLTIDPAAPVGARVGAVVEQRIALFEAIGNVGRITRLRAASQPVIADALRARRAELRAQLAAAFTAELAAMPARQAAGTLAAADVLCSYEAHELLRDDQRLARGELAAALELALGALFQERR